MGKSYVIPDLVLVVLIYKEVPIYRKDMNRNKITNKYMKRLQSH